VERAAGERVLARVREHGLDAEVGDARRDDDVAQGEFARRDAAGDADDEEHAGSRSSRRSRRR